MSCKGNMLQLHQILNRKPLSQQNKHQKNISWHLEMENNITSTLTNKLNKQSKIHQGLEENGRKYQENHQGSC